MTSPQRHSRVPSPDTIRRERLELGAAIGARHAIATLAKMDGVSESVIISRYQDSDTVLELETETKTEMEN